MIKMMNRISSTAMLAVAFMLCATSAWAVTANFVWDSDFGTATKTGLDGKTYTLSLPDDSWLQENGTLKAGSGTKGAYISLKHNNVDNLAQGTKLSVLMEYANATAQSSAVPLYLQADAYFGLKTNGESLDLVGDGWGTTFTPVTTPTMSSTGYLLFVYPQGDGVARAFAASAQSGLSDSSAGGNITSLKYSNKYLQNIVLGGPLNGGNNVLKNFENLVVKRVAVFTSAISASDAASYSFPDYIATVTEADTPWSTVFPSWDDEADNSGKVVYLEIKEGASVTKTTALTAKELIVVGSGTLSLSNTVTASSGITIGSGATVSLSDNTGSSITNYGTLNVNGCSVTGTIKNYGTIATSGTTSIQNASSQFYESGTLSVNGETTLRTANNTSNDTGGLRGRVIINESARLISEYSATPYYSASLTLDLYGELALGSGVRWVVGGNTTVNVYSGGSITGGDTANGGLDWRAGGGVINAYATSTFTAGIRARDNQTITVNVVGSDVVLTAPLYDGGQTGTITKTGDGAWKINDARTNGGVSKIYNKFAGDGGTIEVCATSTSGKIEHYYTGSTYSGILKITNAGGYQNNFVPSSATCFTDDARPEFILNSTDTYFGPYYSGKKFYVRDFSGTGNFKANYGTGPLTYTINTQQTKDTEFSGVLNSNTDRASCLEVIGDDSASIHMLTLSGVNTSTNTLTVSDNAKVRFASTGKWANGIVVVGENGVLESQNSAAIAAKLKVEEGATLAFANGVQLAATAFDWTSVSTDESVNIDLSAVTPSATPVTLIASGVGVPSSKFKVTAAQRTATLSVDNGALKATFPNFWRDGEWLGSLVADDDATLYISQNSTLTVSEALSLGAVTVVKEGEGNVALTISGAGALTTEGWTIPEGVTVNTPTSMSISGTVSGDGVLNIPANTTLAMDDVTCTTKVTVYGTLETSGTTTFSAANTSAAGSLIRIVDGTTTLSSAIRGLSGNITIEAPATLVAGPSINPQGQNAGWNHIDEYATCTLTVRGRVDLGTFYSWEIGPDVTINMYENSELAGSVNFDEGSYAWAGGVVNVYGNATISGAIRTANNASPEFNIAENATLTISHAFVAQNASPSYCIFSGANGSLTKTGAGTLDLTAITPTKPLTINAGTVVAVTAPTTAVVNEAGVLKLTNTGAYKDDRTVNLSGITGTGTIRYNGSGWRSLPNSSGNVFADTLSVELEQESGVPIVVDNTVIGSISGSKNLRSDLGSSGKTFTVKQAKDGVWSGSFHGGWDGLAKVVVQGGASSTGTLTMAGTTTADGGYTYNDELEVASSGSVNLTGLWIGDTTVYGTFGGTGTLNGALTFNAGSTFKVWATDADGLVATGALTPPGNGKVTVDVSSLTIGASEEKVLLTVDSGMNAAKFSQVGNAATHMLAASGQSLCLIPIAATFTSNGVTTPYATVDQAVGFLANPSIPGDSYVTLVHGTTSDLSYTAELLAAYNIVYDSVNNGYVLAEAKIGTTLYPTIEAAIAAVEEDDVVVLSRDVAREEVSVNSEVEFSEGGKTFSGSFTGSGTLILGAPLAAADPARWAEGWTGTVELKDITTVITDFDFADYGNANSTVRANNVLVRMPETSGEYGNVGTIEVATGGLKFGGDPIENANFTFAAAITGTGTIGVGTRCETGSKRMSQYIFTGSMSGFAGGVDYNNTGYYKATIVFKAGNDEIPQRDTDEWGQILVSENTTLKLSKEMYGPAGIVLAGTINVLEGGSIRVDSPSGKQIKGSGTINYTTFPSSAPAFNNSWAGEVHLPGNPSIADTNFGNWGKSGSKIVLDGDVAGWIAQNTSVSAEMVLDGHSLTVNDFSPSSYSFSKISGSGNISFNHKENGYQPSSLTIGEIAPTYSGTVNNNTTATLNITTIALTGGSSVAGGTKLLTIGGTGSFSVGSVTVGGVTQSGLQLAYATDGVYVACASYGGNGYISVAAAIDAAVAADGDVSTITILDGSTTLPAGYEQYYIDNGTVCKCLAYVSKNSGASTIYCNDAIAVAMQTYSGANTYDYVMVLQSGEVELMWFPGYKLKNPNGATITFSNVTEEYTLEYSEEDGLRTYANSTSNRATTYTWTGADSTEAASGDERSWGVAGNWTFVDSSSQQTIATRCPQAGDTVIVGEDATISLSADATATTLYISGLVVFCKGSDLPSQVTRTLTLSDSVVLTAAAATLTVSGGVTMTPAPTTTVSRSRIRSSTSDGATTYRVEVIPGTIFSVY